MEGPRSSGAAPRWAAAASTGALFVCLALSVPFPRPTADNSVTALLSANDARVTAFSRFTQIFGADEPVIVRISGDSPAALVRGVRDLTRALQAAPLVERVFSASTLHGEALELLEDEELGGMAQLDELRWTFEGPLGRSLHLFEPERGRATVLAFLRAGTAEDRANFAATLEALRPKFAQDKLSLTAAGPTLLSVALDREGQAVKTHALPLLAAVVVLALMLHFSSWKPLFALLVPVLLAMVAAQGALIKLEGRTNLVVELSTPLLFVLLLATGIHIVDEAATHRAAGLHARAAAWRAARMKARPASLALLTTAVGFGSLSISDVPPIRTFGWVTAFGLLLGIPLLLGVLPMLLIWVGGAPPPRPRVQVILHRFAARLVALGLRRPRAAMGVAAALTLGGAFVLPALRTEPHAIRYFSPDHPVRAEHDALEADGYGLASLEVLVSLERSVLLDRAALVALDELSTDALSMSGVRGALGLTTFLRAASWELARADRLPEPLVVEAFARARPGPMQAFMTEDGRQLRLSLSIGTLDAEAIGKIRNRLEESFRRRFGNILGSKIEVTGSYELILSAQHAILSTLASSLVVTMVIMAAFLILALRSLPLGVMALLPNVMPVGVGFLFMAALGLPLDVGTAMTAAIALGIAVDGTLHLAEAWDFEAPERTVQRTGVPMVLSAAVVSLGFLALSSSEFAPTRAFGLVTSVVLLAALLGDLVSLPAILSRFAAKSRRTASA